MKVQFTHEIPLNRIAELLCCATEGGISYWCYIDFGKSRKPPEIDKDIGFDAEYRHVCWPLSHGGSLCLVDNEDNTEHYLDLAAVERGLKVMAEKYPHHLANFLKDNEDAETGDVFVQCSVLGEIVYS
jgi:hypothetical protein